MNPFDGLRQAVAAVAREVGPSVVGIGHRWATGSGVVISDGAVLTNTHNLRRGQVMVSFADGRTEPGRPLGVDVDGDLAVVATDTGEIESVAWPEDIAEPAIGDPVMALADPGGRGLRVTWGLVSSIQRSFQGPRGRRIGGSFEHTAPLLPGSSGGPLVDPEGQLLGINTHRLRGGFYLALPADASMRRRVEEMSAGESPRRLRLGVGVAPVDVARRLRRAVGLPEADGLLIRMVEEGGPAERAGLTVGDLIVAVDGQPVTDVDSLYQVLDDARPGAELDVQLLRGVDPVTLTVELAEADAA
ncbi:MAG: S1C family serine protease [Acidimicrobiia bacterium]